MRSAFQKGLAEEAEALPVHYVVYASPRDTKIFPCSCAVRIVVVRGNELVGIGRIEQ